MPNAVTRLAADLHDRVAQSLWCVDVDIDAALACLPPNCDEVRQHLLASRRTIEDAYRDVRLTIGALRANLPFQRDLPEALAARLADFSAQTGLSTELIVNDTAPRWSPFVQLHLLAIVQHGLDNVVRHAMANRVVVTFDRIHGGWSLTLRDDGRGFPPSSALARDPAEHYGLTIMRERTESFGGSFVIQSTLGEGTALIISIPDTAATPRA
jgi:two-component system, NarL family, nitrate/nitrite sensor histidine kinase NarX